MPVPDLRGARLLVTRPAHQAEGLCRRVEAAGGKALLLPALEILEPSDPSALPAIFNNLGNYHLVIFVSANAVAGARQWVGSGEIPAKVALAAVGQGTAREVEERFGRRPDFVPSSRFDSEGLLAALPADLTGQRILIVRGEGGRELLATGLKGRGGGVDYAEVYRRAKPSGEGSGALEEADIVTAASGETLRNLVEMAGPGGRARLLGRPLVVINTRVAQIAAELGFTGAVAVAETAGEEAIIAAAARLLTALHGEREAHEQ